MTERLYFQDSYVTTFEATIVQHVRISDQLAVVLDRTYFYPTSGGQPNDLGTINGVPVIDVSTQEDGTTLKRRSIGAVALTTCSNIPDNTFSRLPLLRWRTRRRLAFIWERNLLQSTWM